MHFSDVYHRSGETIAFVVADRIQSWSAQRCIRLPRAPDYATLGRSDRTTKVAQPARRILSS